MTTRFVYRLLDADDELLGWTEAEAEARGDGALRAAHVIMIAIDRAGIPAVLSIHWVDVNVESRVTLQLSHSQVHVGGAVMAYAPGDVVLQVGAQAGGLPPVTVGRCPVVINIPVGNLAGVGTR